MTRRLTLAILATVLISVLLAGIGSLLLVRHEDRRATLEDLQSNADALALIFGEIRLSTPDDSQTIRQRLVEIQRELRVVDAELLVITNNRVSGRIPASLADVQIDLRKLRADGGFNGSAGSTVFAAAHGQRRNFEFIVILTSDGSRVTGPVTRWILLSTGLAVAAGGLIAWLLGRRLSAPLQAATATSRRIADGDLSARVELEAERTDEIGELASTINDMAASLERSRGLERQFLLSVSHDLRTPLTSIRGYAEAIADGAAPDNTRAARIIGSEARRLERLVTDLLDLAKLDARQFRLELGPTDLSQLVPDVGAGFEHQANQQGIEVIIDGPDARVIAVADPDRLAQVVANLLDNALKFAESRVLLTYRASATGIEVVVADDGAGITSADLPRVFERLYVSHQAPLRRETGSGLGLAIVKELVEAMGGTVNAFARPTGGTQFVVTLKPVAAAAT